MGGKAGQSKETRLEELILRHKGSAPGRRDRAGQTGSRPALPATHTVTVGGKLLTDEEWFAHAAHGARLSAKGDRPPRLSQARAPR